MTTSTRRLAAGFFVLTTLIAPLLFVSTAQAESPPDAMKWLTKLSNLYERAPLMVDFEIGLPAGSAMSGTAKGSLIQQDETRMRMEIALDVNGAAGGSQGQQAMNMKMLTVNDGEVIWTEMDMGFGKQVIKLTKEEIENLGAASTLAGNSFDPLAQVETMAEVMDFKLIGIEGGQVTLEGKINEKAHEAFGVMPMEGVETVTLVIDEKNAFPTRVVVGDGTNGVTIDFNNLRFVSVDDLPEGSFSYTPPEGVMVMDANALKAMQPRAGQQ